MKSSRSIHLSATHRTLALTAVWASLSTLNPHLSTCLAQGNLTPPGAPAPTMKTLDQLDTSILQVSNLVVQATNQVRTLSNELNQAISLAEPRTPITASTTPGDSLSLFIITQPGSYYLTDSVAASVNGITVNTNDVTVDLMGFTLSGDGGGGDLGINVNQHNRVTVRHGTIRNLGYGVYITAPATNTLVEDVLVQGCVNGGFNLHGNDGTVRNCRSSGNAVGFNLVNGVRNVIEDCQAVDNIQTGFLIGGTNNLIIRNLAGGNPANDYSIGPSNRVGTIALPALTTGTVTSGGPSSGTTDPFANLRY